MGPDITRDIPRVDPLAPSPGFTPDQPETAIRPDRYDDDFDPRKPKVFIGGRKSLLAVVQSRSVGRDLRKVHPGLNFPVLAVSTLGDKVHNRPLYAFGGKALWTKELEILLLEQVEGFEKIDMIVHSLKDMPTTMPEGCVLGAITEREDPRDAICMKAGSPYRHLNDLPDNSIVGTSSIRRSAQLKRRYPNLQFVSVRGSIQTRLEKLDNENSNYACIILAAAGLNRVKLYDRISSYLDSPDMYYAVGQGALGIEIRAGDERIKRLVQKINHIPTSMCCRAERGLMKALEGGCSVPIGVESRYDAATSSVTLHGIVVSTDGVRYIESEHTAVVHTEEDAEKVGFDLAYSMIQMGAKQILDDIHLEHIN